MKNYLKNFKIRHLWLSLFLISFILTQCKKDPSVPLQDVSFNINSVNQSAKTTAAVQSGELRNARSLETDTIICSSLAANYVKYKVDGGGFRVIPVFYVDGIPYTSSIKLQPGNHNLNEFLVYSDNQTPKDSTDDVLLSAVPHTGAIFASYARTNLDYSFTVSTDKKTDVNLDVVCYTPAKYLNFGFVYFQLSPLVIRSQWFFGDFCIKDATHFAGSGYSQQTNWVASGFIDAPAIFKIEVWRNGVLENTFQNSNQGEKVLVNYGDYQLSTDNFEFKLYILVNQGSKFVYTYFNSWKFNDISNIKPNSNNVVDFVLGNCYDPSNPPSLILPPWMNLPATATYTITAYPSVLGGYVDATLTNIASGTGGSAIYDFSNGVFASNCADHSTEITVGTSYNMDVYSSLYQSLLPAYLQSAKWEKINWLYNHLDWYSGYNWYDIQGFIWLYDNPVWDGSALGTVPAITALTKKMKSDADTYGPGYKVLPGGWVSVIFALHGATSPTVQTMFVRLDP